MARPSGAGASHRTGTRYKAVFLFALFSCLLCQASSALTGYRRVHAWGFNRFGQLGIDHVPGQSRQAKPDQCEPQFVPTLGHESLKSGEGSNLQRIVSGQNHAVAITDEGDMYVWGNNDMGQLGLGVALNEDTTQRFKPTLLELFNPNGWKLKVVDVAVGLEHTLALVNGGRVYAWGSNQYGQLGLNVDPETTPFSSIPQALDVGGELVQNVSAAAGHSAALTFTGAVFMWGANHEGQLGLGGCTQPDGRANDPCLNAVQKPTKILRTADGGFMPQIKFVACGGHVAGGTDKALEGGHTIAVSQLNEVWGWGDNFHGQVGKPQEYTKIADHTEVYTPNKYDDVTGRYYNREVMPARVGYLGVEKYIYPPPPAPIAFPPPPAVEGEEAEINVTATVTMEETIAPPPPPDMTDAPLEIVALKAGSHHSIALVRTGEMFAWGDNFHGQLGLGYISEQREPDRFQKTQEYRAPEMIDRPTRLKHFDYINTKVTAKETLNSTIFVETSERVTGRIQSELDARITQIDAGNFQTIALSSKGNIFIWGTNALGQQGTCDCGACMANYDAAGTCPLIEAPPAPPSPDAPVIAGITYEAAPFVPNIDKYEWNDECECNCAGTGTCNYTPQVENENAINAGRCVGFGENTQCECTPPYLEMTGRISKMDTPMTFAVDAATNFTFVTVAAGGAMFAVSEAECPTDNIGNECSLLGKCASGEDEDTLKACDCPFGTAVSSIYNFPSCLLNSFTNHVLHFVQGIFCEHTCPVGTEDDYRAVREDHNIIKFPDSRYREDTDGVMTNEVCSGHGVCDDKGACECNEYVSHLFSTAF